MWQSLLPCNIRVTVSTDTGKWCAGGTICVSIANNNIYYIIIIYIIIYNIYSISNNLKTKLKYVKNFPLVCRAR